ncbi:MAG: hypothetical protein Q4D29_11055 [Lachnospiraceae bacterium]|nr:hypothetical protein [Lachnospiraceae bacterium]
MAEYSVLLHMYLNEETLQKRYTFTICKTVMGKDELCTTKLLVDLINEEKDVKNKKRLLHDNEVIYAKFLGKKIEPIPLLLEYDCL